MKKLVEIFQELKTFPNDDLNSYRIRSIPKVKNHKIGLSNEDKPIFFIQCTESSKKSMDINLEQISVQYDLNCQINDGVKVKNSKYTIISLKSNSWSLQEYFIQIVGLMIERLPEIVTHENLKTEINTLVKLFISLSRPAIKSIQGLWAELLIIEQAKDPNYLVLSWHINPSDKYDFNDGISKVEIKSTSKNRRIHRFSIDQLNPNITSDLIIGSIITAETGMGTNIFDLLDKIQIRINNNDLIIRVNQIIAESLGTDFEKANEIYFDYQLAKDSIKFYNVCDLPRISLADVPYNVLNVQFDSDLTDIENLKDNNSENLLHISLF